MGAGVTLRMLPVAIALTRSWLRVYTCRMPRHLADARRAEIESDLWEMQHDPELPPGLRGGSMAMARLIDGMADDIAWRVDNAAVEEQFVVRRAFAVTAATVLVLSLWTVPTWLFNGDRDLTACAAAAPRLPASGRLDDVIRCAGAHFSFPR